MSANGEILTLIKREDYQDKLIIRASDGKSTFANSEHVFRSGVDPRFKRWGLVNESLPALKMEVEGYHLSKPATFEEMFNFFGVDLERLCLTKNQVIDFCFNNYELSESPDETFILFRKDELQPATLENLFVAKISESVNGLQADVGTIYDNSYWYTRVTRRIIVPKL